MRNCIPTKYMCDGVKDCEDGSDEIECSCSEDEFQCSRRIEGGNVRDNLYQCISLNFTKDEKCDCLSEKDVNRLVLRFFVFAKYYLTTNKLDR